MNHLPQWFAVALGALAFIVAWAVGLLSGVPPFHVTLRALGAAAIFGVVGHFLGRLVLRSILDSVAEHLRRQHEAQRTASEKNR